MGYSREEDEESVRILSAVTMGSDLVDPDDIREGFGKVATVVGAAASMEDDLIRMPPEGRVVCAGSATGRALDAGVDPYMVVTDLDGDIGPQLESSSRGAVTLIHAHGGNADLIRRYAGLFRGPVVLTTQSTPGRTVFDFGGFTDGDRAACAAEWMGAERILMAGFDFEHPYPKAGTDPAVKLRKLRWAERILGMLRAELVYPPERRSATTIALVL